jgi:hypothetical protein
MAHFTTSAKRFPEGTSYAGFGGANLNVPSGGDDFTYTAPAELPDAPHNRQFLFWDTGRRVTTKRTVHWTFTHPDSWTTWNAVAWYGDPTGSGPGSHTISATAYWVGTSLMDPTPIDGAASTFAGAAWPAGGNDHNVDTEFGPGTLRALGHLQRHAGDPVLNFSGLARLVFGGDDSGVFEENDNDLPTGGTTPIGIEGSDLQLAYGQGESAIVLASYVTPAPVKVVPPQVGPLQDIGSILKKFLDRGDPSPEDIVRIRALEEVLGMMRGKPAQIDAFANLAEAAKNMTPAELKRTIAATEAQMRRGQVAIKSMQALAGSKRIGASAGAAKARATKAAKAAKNIKPK